MYVWRCRGIWKSLHKTWGMSIQDPYIQCVNWTIVGELSSLEGERNKGSTEEVIFPFWLNDCISTFQEWKRNIYYTLRKTIRENDVLFCSCIYSVYLMYIYVWDIPAHIIYFFVFFFCFCYADVYYYFCSSLYFSFSLSPTPTKHYFISLWILKKQKNLFVFQLLAFLAYKR